MWEQTYSQRVQGVTAEQLWNVWKNVDQWALWQQDIEYAKLNGDFIVGNAFVLKVKGGPKVNIQLVQVEPGKMFKDLTRFPLAKMYGIHEFIPAGEDLEIKTTVRVEGPFTFLWRKLVAEGIAKGLPEQTENLIRHATARKRST